MRAAWSYWRAAWRWNALGATHDYFTSEREWRLDSLEVKAGAWNERYNYREIRARFVGQR